MYKLQKGIPLLTFLLFVSITLYAQIPGTLSYQGLLTDQYGQVVADDEYFITFRLYDSETSGKELWVESQSILVTDGVINVQLGAVNALNLPFDKPYWLGISVGKTDEMEPRIPLSASAYSFRSAGVEDGAVLESSLADGSVTAAKIADGAVGTEKLADNISISTTGIITATAFIGDGSQLTGLPGGNGDGLWGLNSDVVYRLFGRVAVGTLSTDANFEVSAGSGTRSVIRSSVSGSASLDLIGTHTSTILPGIIGSIRFRDNNNAEKIVGRIDYVNGPASQIMVPGMRFQTDGTTRLIIRENGRIGVGTNNPVDQFHVVGTTRTNILRITGGSDLAERFDVLPVEDFVPLPGMVVSIDPDNPGKLVPSLMAYDRRVAGVVSGANGINSGMIMGQEGSIADGSYPVALAGRVYVLAESLDAEIVPGDLLTTSAIPGHVKVVRDHARAAGAILGKAMTPLPAGEKGFILMLVSLQ